MAKALISQRIFVSRDRLGYDVYLSEPQWSPANRAFLHDDPQEEVFSGAPFSVVSLLLGVDELETGRCVQCSVRTSKIGRVINHMRRTPK